MPYKIMACGLSDIGLVRQNNEDVWAALPEVNFYALADGMGGHQAGEIAAKEAVNALCKIIKKYAADKKLGFHDARKQLLQAIEHVNGLIYKMGRANPGLRGMGTTLCCMYFHEKGLVYGHVGDSRIYRLRNKRLEQITKDHSLIRELVDMGQISEQHATDFLYKNIITKAIGTEPKVEPTVHLSEVLENDVYLMCSDGLSDLLSLKEIQAILNQGLPVDGALKELVATANARGGHDNITVVIMKVTEIDETKDIS